MSVAVTDRCALVQPEYILALIGNIKSYLVTPELRNGCFFQVADELNLITLVYLYVINAVIACS